MEPIESKRLRLRMGLQALMLLVLVSGLWLGRQVNRARDQHAAAAAVQRFGGRLVYDWEVANGARGGRPPAPRWLLRILGDEYFQEIVCIIMLIDKKTGEKMGAGGVKFTDAFLSSIKNQSGLKYLRFTGTYVSDEGLGNLQQLTNLKTLDVYKAREITDSGLVRLEPLKSLSYLRISDSKISDKGLASLTKLSELGSLAVPGAAVTDAGLVHLQSLKRLRSLDLQKTLVTDAGLEHLRGLPQLTELNLGGTRVTVHGMARLESAMPGLKIVLKVR